MVNIFIVIYNNDAKKFAHTYIQIKFKLLVNKRATPTQKQKYKLFLLIFMEKI